MEEVKVDKAVAEILKVIEKWRSLDEVAPLDEENTKAAMKEILAVIVKEATKVVVIDAVAISFEELKCMFLQKPTDMN